MTSHCTPGETRRTSTVLSEIQRGDIERAARLSRRSVSNFIAVTAHDAALRVIALHEAQTGDGPVIGLLT